MSKAYGSKAYHQKSIKQAKDRLTQTLKLIDKDFPAVVAREAQKVLEEAQSTVPYETGKLQESIKVRVSNNAHRYDILASASATNDKTGFNYAGVQHEDPNYKHDEGRKYHYLSDPLRHAADRLHHRFRRRMKHNARK